MKKSLIVLLSVTVVLAFAASAFALHQITASEYTPGLVKAGKAQIELGGEIRIRGDMKKNANFNEDIEDTTQKYDQRVRLRTKAMVADKTFALIELESGSNTNDSTVCDDANGDGILNVDECENVSNTNNSKNVYEWGQAQNSKRGAMYIRQAYISHQFGSIGGMKAGHMLLALGNRLFFDHTNYGDDALLGWIAAGPAEVSIIDIKLEERTNANKHQMDDADAYVLAFEMPINDQINVSADVTYIRDRDMETYDKGLNFFNVGIRADADLKVVKVKGDIEIQTGKAKKAVETATQPKELKYSGIAGMLGAEGTVGPVTIRGGAAYGSGDKQDETDKADKKYEGFVTSLTDNQYSTFVYDYSVKGATGSTNQGLANTMYLTIGASMQPMPDLKVSADAYYLSAAREVALNNARDNVGVACSNNHKDNCERSKKLGYEIDAKVEYQIASNLVYYIEAGYLFVGDAYDRWDVSKSKNQDGDNPYRVRHGLLLTF